MSLCVTYPFLFDYGAYQRMSINKDFQEKMNHLMSC